MFASYDFTASNCLNSPSHEAYDDHLSTIMLCHDVICVKATRGQWDSAQPDWEKMRHSACLILTAILGEPISSRQLWTSKKALSPMYHLTPRPFVSSGLKYCSSSLFSYVLPIISLCLPCFWLKMEYKWNKNGAVVILKLSTELLWCWVGMSGRNRTMGRRRRKRRRREGRGGVVVTHSGGDDKAFSLLSQP